MPILSVYWRLHDFTDIIALLPVTFHNFNWSDFKNFVWKKQKQTQKKKNTKNIKKKIRIAKVNIASKVNKLLYVYGVKFLFILFCCVRHSQYSSHARKLHVYSSANLLKKKKPLRAVFYFLTDLWLVRSCFSICESQLFKIDFMQRFTLYSTHT